VILLATSTASARAQEVLTANVPFTFVAGQTAFPAGRYEIRREDTALATFQIAGIDRPLAAYVLPVPMYGRDPAGDAPALVFERHEDTYRLAEVWESSNFGLELPGRLRTPARDQEGHVEGSGVIVAALWR
jgi:hypothetical protein